jgi:hypothetical protein
MVSSVRRTGLVVAVVGLLLGLGLRAMPANAADSPLLNAKCLKCHTEFKEMKDVMAGDFESRSNKAKSIQVNVGEQSQLVKFTTETEVVNAESIKALQKPIPVLVAFERQGEDLVATKITAKPIIKVPENQLIDVEGVAALLTQSPDSYLLVDSRPPIRYHEGHVPTAISMPFPKMPEMLDKLPQEKDRLVVFYCGGFR